MLQPLSCVFERSADWSKVSEHRRPEFQCVSTRGHVANSAVHLRVVQVELE